MIGSILNYLLSGKRDSPAGPAPGNDPREKKVAALVILIEVARSDERFSPEEQDVITRVCREDFGFSDGEVRETLEAAEKQRREASGVYAFTRVINQRYDKQEKLDLMKVIWRVIFADGRLDKHEDYMAHKLASLLRLNHRELIAAKMAVRSGSR